MELPRHEKIRFRRCEIANLAGLPSAGTDAAPARRFPFRRAGAILARIALAAAGLLLLALLALYGIGASGIGSERLTVRSFGETEPIADNGTPEGRAENRRVVLKPLTYTETR